MSYILDALNRAERERRGVSLADPANTRSRSGTVMLVIAALLAVNAGLLGWWILTGEVAELSATVPADALDTEPAEIEAPVEIARPVPVQMARPVPVDLARPSPIDIDPPAPVEIARPAPAVQPPAPATTRVNAREESSIDRPETITPAQTSPVRVPDDVFTTAVTLEELDSLDRIDFPDLNFTSHTYTSDPRSRFVHINGQRWHEGNRIGDEVVLRTITASTLR